MNPPIKSVLISLYKFCCLVCWAISEINYWFTGIWYTVSRSSLLVLLCFMLFMQQIAVLTRLQGEDGESKPEEEKATLEHEIEKSYNPCCWFPCKNGGICMQHGDTYECDCTGLNYYGPNCSTPTWWQFFKNLLLPSPTTLLSFPGNHKWFWDIVNCVPFLHRLGLTYIYLSRGLMVQSPPCYTSQQDYITLDSYYNTSFYARELPPVPRNCPTEMGFTGPKKLPPIEDVYERLFRRKHFKPDELGTNLLFATYAQHFVHQFFKTDYKRGIGYTFGMNEGVDVSQIYGQDEHTRMALRCGCNGKLKTKTIDGEEFPPYLNDTPGVYMFYPSGILQSDTARLQPREWENVEPKWAFGHHFFSMTPLIFVIATLWIREHNRVCDILREEHPFWDDEQLYQTARLIIAGEMVKITLENYVQHLSQYHYTLKTDPTILHHSPFQFSNRIRVEFNYIYHWHSMIPDSFTVDGQNYTYEELFFTNNSVIFKHGMDNWIKALVNNIAGAITYNNHPNIVEPLTHSVIKGSRALRIQSFNNYRAYWKLPRYTSFLDLVGDAEIAKHLEELYQDVDAVEFFIGVLMEKHDYSVVPPSMVLMGGSWSVKGLLASPFLSEGWWKPSTFGGQVGMDIITNANLKSLVCNNIRNQCRDIDVSFRVPPDILENILKEHETPPLHTPLEGKDETAQPQEEDLPFCKMLRKPPGRQ